MNREKVQQDLLEKIADLIEDDSELRIVEKLGVLSILQFSLIASAGGLMK